MPLYDHILDNQTRSVADYLRPNLRDAEAFRLVSAYFTIYGYELLADELDRLREVRFLFGDPTSVDDLDPGEKAEKSFELTESGLVPNHTLQQKFLAQRCARWVQSDSVHIKSIKRSNFLHGKMYLADNLDTGVGVVGSSNFTKSGLGGSDRPNLEINLAITDSRVRDELRRWFDDLWKDGRLTHNVKSDVLNALGRIGKEHAPEFIYFKTLYEIFREQIDAHLEGAQRLDESHLYDTEIWNALYGFQKDGAKSVIHRLQRRNGCILADSVGLGKTYTALAVIKYFELRNERVLVLCPRKLRENWSLYPAYNAHSDNPFIEDRFGYTLLSHTDLSRVDGLVGTIDLSKINWGSFDLVVIDESHNFRNHRGQRYERLTDEIVKQGINTKVLMLSATPVNTSLIDLRNQIHLMTAGRDDSFGKSLGIRSISTVVSGAQREFKKWESANQSKASRNKVDLLEKLGPEFFRLLDAVSISRSRRQIERFYSTDIDSIGSFPEHAAPDNRHPPTDLRGELSYRDLAKQIGKFQLSIYQPTKYLTDEARGHRQIVEQKVFNFTQEDREHYLIGMMRTNFLKRLESSPHSLVLTLKRTVGKIDDLLGRIETYLAGHQENSGDQIDVLPEEDEDDEDLFINRAGDPYHLRELDLSRWRSDLIRDRAVLDETRKKVAAVTPERDGKLREIERAIRDKVQSPNTDQDGNPNRKLLVFTTFKDTAEYLYDNLIDLADELGLNMAMVVGDATRTTIGANNFNAILTNFAPRARNRSSGNCDIDLIVATDCISEGQNLQDCDTVLNYDIHWNPVRLIQRFGRIDRIGSRNRSVRMVNFWPTDDMEVYLNLENRVLARMALADMAATGQDDPLDPGEAESAAAQELSFRDQQLMRLLEEVPDLDDLDDGPAMGDFTLDYFFAQLLRYLQQNRDELEALPPGAYAVTNPDSPAGSGVIFFLRQRNASDDRDGMASPIHPFYLVFIRDDGSIRLGCANAKQALELFDKVTSGESVPILELCDHFNQQTDNGQDMSRYNNLLKSVIAHISRAHGEIQASSLGIDGIQGFILSDESESPTSAEDFELVTWLVMLEDPAHLASRPE